MKTYLYSNIKIYIEEKLNNKGSQPYESPSKIVSLESNLHSKYLKVFSNSNDDNNTQTSNLDFHVKIVKTPKQAEKENNIIQKILDSSYSVHSSRSRMFANKVLNTSNSKRKDKEDENCWLNSTSENKICNVISLNSFQFYINILNSLRENIWSCISI